MTYDETKDSEQLRSLDVAISEFIFRYNSKPSTARRQTMIFFPGGMGSELIRARTPYKDDVLASQTFAYQTIWLNYASFMRDEPDWNALNLRMHKNSQGNYRDHEDRIIIASGAIKVGSRHPLDPYDDFLDWCERIGLDWFVFGWDWRRRPEETAKFFVQRFLPRFRSKVIDLCEGADPLSSFCLVGHSFGGIIVNLVLREIESDALADKMTRAIAVATPFYGYSGQLHHWFKANPLFADLGEKHVVEVASSLPASYTLNWLDLSTFKTNEAALRADPKYPLVDYPSVDAIDSEQPADPYDPQTNGTLVRYPATTGFDMDELRHARDVCRRLTEPFATKLAEKFYNIRGVQVTQESKPENKTLDDTGWSWINPAYDPDDDETPIRDGLPGPGDGLLPAWSTHLVSLPEGNRITVEGDLDHTFIMENSLIQNALGELFGVEPATTRSREPRLMPLPEPATSEEALAYVKGLQQLRKPGLVSVDRSDVVKYHDQFSHGKLRSIYHRIMLDMLH